MADNPTILPNEKELFTRMAAGDEAAFTDIFFHYIPILQPHVFRMTRSEEVAQDILHDSFLSLWKNREKMTGVENYKAYVYRVATNKTYNWLKKMATERLAIVNATRRSAEFSNETEETIDLNESSQRVQEAIEQLPPQKKKIFRMSREEGLTHEQIAQQLNISKNTVHNHLTEALRMLKENLRQTPGASFILLGMMLGRGVLV